METDPHRVAGEFAPCFAQWQKSVVAAEQGEGWLAECTDAGRYLAVSQELVDALASVLRRLAGDDPVLEICAGNGELARALVSSGVDVEATDLEASAGTGVRSMPADTALRHFQPKVVLGSFVPFDSGADEAVLACPSVQYYVVLNARIGGLLGAAALWQASGWKAEPLTSIGPWMLTRHDVWLGPLEPSEEAAWSDWRSSPTPSASGSLLQHGEAWLFARDSSTASSDTERACR